MFLELKHQPTGQVLKIDAFWLRDHCRCADCYNVATKQRKYNLLDIAATVKPTQQSYAKDGLVCLVKWSDGHSSRYDMDVIYDAQFEQRKRRVNQRTPWQRETVLQQQQSLRVALPDLLQSKQKLKELVTALVRYGIAFIDDVPPTTADTELAIRHVFPVMKTFFGEMWTFSDVQEHADTAYTKEYLGSHTDNTYFCDPAGLQALHCIKHVNGQGGENFFVDGLHAVQKLRHLNPTAFELLCRVHVPAEYIEQGEHHRHSAPIISTDPLTGEIVQLRLNVYDRATFDTIPQTAMQEFYAALRELLQIVQREENQWTFKLEPGTIVIFDNWRVLHGRLAYTGLRTMTGCYVQRTDFLSKARILGIHD